MLIANIGAYDSLIPLHAEGGGYKLYKPVEGILVYLNLEEIDENASIWDDPAQGVDPGKGPLLRVGMIGVENGDGEFIVHIGEPDADEFEEALTFPIEKEIKLVLYRDQPTHLGNI